MTINIAKYGFGKPLVLFHGWGFDGHVFSPIINSLTKYQLYIVDLPGFGLTKYMSWDEFKINLLKHLPEKFSLLGWSLGGLVATRLCIEAQSRVENLINVTSSPKFIKELGWVGIDKVVFEKFYLNFQNNPIKTRTNFINTELGISDASLDIGPTNDMTLGLKLGLDWLLEWDLRNDLIDISIPTLYMFGRLDAIIPRRLMLKMQHEFPHLNYFMFDKAAHAPFLTHTNEFINSLNEFIK